VIHVELEHTTET